MSNAKTLKFLGGAWQVYCALEQIEGFRRAREQEARVSESLDEARRVRAFMEREEASEKLGAGRLGSADDAARLGMFDPDGLFLGALDGNPLFYSGPGHLLHYGQTQSGKGRDFVLTNLAHVANRSMIVTDIKNGENAYASAHHRRHNLGHRTLPLNPSKLLNGVTFRLNPFDRLVHRAQAGQSIAIECIQTSMSIVAPMKGGDKWVSDGAQEYAGLWIEHCARFRPEDCKLSNLWRFVNGQTAEMLKDISRCGDEALEYMADDALRTIKDAPEQWQAYHSAMRSGMRPFRPGEPLALATEKSDFDPASLRHEPTTVYLMTEERALEASAQWIALTISALLETSANTPGPVPVTFLIDELANLPYMSVIPKALTLYAGLGIQLWGLCQGRNSLEARGYSLPTIKTFEEQAGIFGMWGVEDTSLMRDVETWSGKKAVATKGINNSGGQVSSASFGLTEHSRSVLQSEDIRAVYEGRQIIRRSGNHLFIADRVPYYAVPSWKTALRDVRTLHHAQRPMASPPPLPGRSKAPPPLPTPIRFITHQKG